MTKYKGHILFQMICEVLYKLDTRKMDILVEDFHKKVSKLGVERRLETLSWVNSLSGEIMSFENFKNQGMAESRPFIDIHRRLEKIISVIDVGLNDCFVKPQFVNPLMEIKDKLSRIRDNEYEDSLFFINFCEDIEMKYKGVMK